MARPTTPIYLTKEQQQALESIANSREISYSLVQRSQIILKAAAGMTNRQIAQEINLAHENVGIWRKRWLQRCHELEKWTGNPKQLRAVICQQLSDNYRSGHPGKFTPEQICQIIALACEKPPAPLTHWTIQDLTREAVKRSIVESISTSSIWRFLKSGGFKTTSHSILA